MAPVPNFSFHDNTVPPSPRAIPGREAGARAAKTAEQAAAALKEGQLVVSETQKQTGQFTEEMPDVWEGYVEWELYPDKRAVAHELMKKTKFPPPPEFQLAPLPNRNPILYGDLYKDFHHAVGMDTVPEYSWGRVIKEKAKSMTHVLAFPYNGEPNHDELMKAPITPNNQHFVRNHGGIPKCIDLDKFTIEIGGKVKKNVTLSLKDLKDPSKFPQRKLAVTLQCCGTRRIEQIALYPGHGLLVPNAPWPEGAIGNAVYTGVYLQDVLERACGGITVDRMLAHAEFISADTYFKSDKLYNYSVSVPYRFVDKENVMLAWDMNGEPLPEIHGHPLRVVVPGVIGARSAKWLTRINILDEPSWGPVQRMEYLYYSNTQYGKHNTLYSNGFSIERMPVSSAIMAPHDGDIIVHNGSLDMQGWAYSGGENWVERVECSVDGGHTWYPVPEEDLSRKQYYTWRLWKASVPLDAEGWVEVMVRAWDSSCNTQPISVRSVWNWDLHVTQSCHKIKLYSVNKTKPLTAKRLKAYEEAGLDFVNEPITRPVPWELEDPEEYKARVRKFPREPLPGVE